ncbi:MAG: ferric reductase [Acidimicrobiales bacterium]|nr:ferric reductase [Acidimicrobiales bacterium]
MMSTRAPERPIDIPRAASGHGTGIVDRSAPIGRSPSGVRYAVLTAIWVGAMAVAWWPIVVALNGPSPLRWAPVVAHVCGMLAGYAVLALIALMSRAPALERNIGADVLARWHSRGGRLVVTLILIHAYAAVVGWAQSRREGMLVAFWQVANLPWLMAATIGTIMLVVVGVASARAARSRMSYEKWHAIHLLTYVAIALSFVHQLAGPDLAGRRLLQVVWALLYTHVFAMLIRHRVLTPIRQAARHRMRVADIIPEGPGVVSIVVEGEHLTELQAESGQFFRWRFLTPDLWLTAHPFSLSAAPTADRLRLTVKALGQGSQRLQDIAIGTWVVTEGPYGAMTSVRRSRDDILLIAGGVGITPMRALFETIPLVPGQDLTLLYRARNAGQVLFGQELDEIARRRGARVHYLVGDNSDCLSATSILALVPNVARRDVYMCGPPGMTEAVRASLHGAGLSDDYIHEERFAF